MKFSIVSKIRQMLVGFVAAIVLGGGSANADFTFGTPGLLGPEINTSTVDISPCISSNGLSLYFSSMRGGGFGQFDLWVSNRQRLTDSWGSAVNLGPTVNTSAYEANPSISFDGLSLFFSDSIPGFASPRPGGYGNGDIWISKRQSVNDEWGIAKNLGPVCNTPFREEAPYISADGLSLFFTSDRDGGYGGVDIWVSTRRTKQEPWTEPFNMGPLINSQNADSYFCLSGDGLCLFLSSIRPPSRYWDIWITTRKVLSSPWAQPILLGETINTGIQDVGTAIMPDGSAFYYSSRISGFMDIFEVPIIPVVDFNRDGNIDTDDLIIMIDNWGTDDSTCDIGPMPWGDGVVDIEDLKVFMSYWEQENMPKEPEVDEYIE